MDIIRRNYSQQLVIVVEYVLCVQYVNKDDKNPVLSTDISLK